MICFESLRGGAGVFSTVLISSVSVPFRIILTRSEGTPAFNTSRSSAGDKGQTKSNCLSYRFPAATYRRILRFDVTPYPCGVDTIDVEVRRVVSQASRSDL